jgi:hypothetical protein
MRRFIGVVCVVVVLGGIALMLPGVRSEVKALIRPEEPPPLTPLTVTLPPTATSSMPTALPSAMPTTSSTRTPVAASPTAIPDVVTQPAASELPSATSAPSASVAPTATELPLPTPTRGPVEVNGRWYDAYIPAASKEAQAYQYSC